MLNLLRKYFLLPGWGCGCNPDYAQRMIARPSQQTIKNIMVMALRLLSPSVPGGAVIL